MFKLKKLKKIFIIAVLLTVVGMSSSVFATSTQTISSGTTSTTQQIPTLNSSAGGTTGTSTTNPISTINNTTTPVTTNTNTTNTNTANTNTNSSVYNNTSLPKTGVDYSIIFIILACVACAVYAYIKIRDYNNIKY